jgi:hypothetical protein
MIAIAFVALLLRVYGADFGLPLHYHIDEERVMSRVIRMVTTGDLNPRFFHYPSFIFYFLGSLVALYYFVHYIPFAFGAIAAGRSFSLSAFGQAFQADEAFLYLLSRVSMGAVGMLTVVLVYILVRRLIDRRAAFFTSIFLALCPLHVIESHYIKQEVLMTFFMILALYIGVRGAKRSTDRPAYGPGAAAGIAASVKYNGVLALAVTPLLFRVKEKLRLSSFIGRGPILTVVVAVAAFLFFSPYILLDFGRFSADFAFEMFHVAEKGHHAFDLNGDGLVFHRFFYQILAAFPFSLGLPVYVVALAGVVFALLKKERPFVWLLFFAVPYFIMTAMMKVVFLRYYMPLVVVLCILAGYGMSVMISRGGWLGRISWVIGVVVILYTASVTLSIELSMPLGQATLDHGLEWVRDRVPEGSKVAFTHFTPPLTEEPYDLVHMRPHYFNREWLEQESPDVIIVSGLVTVGFERGGTGVEEGKALLEDLRKKSAGYRRAAFFEHDFVGRSFWGSVDPTLGQTFMPDIEIFVREGAR